MPTTPTTPDVLTTRAIQTQDGPTFNPGHRTAHDREQAAVAALQGIVADMATHHQLTPREGIAWLRRILNCMDAEAAIATLADATPILRDGDDYGCDMCCRPEGCPMCRLWDGALPPSCDPNSPF
jgi:hypothetical protein